ncbi:hypothetical protein JANAI62_02470 [Jannaschia pagri]|uniref:Oxidoreductase n=1 Tax=Jannaschia pagri TaxID=2829797 RepID=A0ABQ4NGT2_9RHOB|nr:MULTISPECIES: hypothetical protein [unclassified Jannaschia]GIT90270.1 hypothetical protein JANAI61_07280 [Jannaschia sp. AI_61]GIT93624.1 hypothetical protein JANAI62_02470 [Jannaschia sp. AI_62]
MAMVDTFADYSRKLPTIRSSDWFLRIPLAIIIMEQGALKIPDMALQAEGFGIPLVLFALATFAEIAGGAAILLGGFLRNNWMTDLLTRLGGLAISVVVAGVIALLYFGPFSGWQFQGLLLAGGLFFLFRGNGDVKDRSVI